MRYFSIFFLSLLIPFNLYAGVYVDDLKRNVVITHPPERIISLAPSVTESLFALGMGGKIVGVTKFCNYPREALNLPKVGGFSNPNLEVIISLKPDLIVATFDGNDKANVEKLISLGYPVYLQNSNNIEETFTSIEKLGVALGKAETARELVSEMKSKYRELRLKVKGLASPKIFFEIGSDQWSVSDRTFIGDLIKKAGGTNIVGDLNVRYARINLETIISLKPDIIIISSMANSEKLPEIKQKWRKWSTIPAVKNDRVYIIQSDIVNRAGPRIVDALEQLVNIIHRSTT